MGYNIIKHTIETIKNKKVDIFMIVDSKTGIPIRHKDNPFKTQEDAENWIKEEIEWQNTIKTTLETIK